MRHCPYASKAVVSADVTAPVDADAAGSSDDEHAATEPTSAAAARPASVERRTVCITPVTV